MGSVRDGIDAEMREWIERQLVFFVATAPLSADGHVNMSPKGLDTFAVTGERSVRYLDLTGSAAETVAHLGENGRITIMFCGFEDPPRSSGSTGAGPLIWSVRPTSTIVCGPSQRSRIQHAR